MVLHADFEAIFLCQRQGRGGMRQYEVRDVIVLEQSSLKICTEHAVAIELSRVFRRGRERALLGNTIVNAKEENVITNETPRQAPRRAPECEGATRPVILTTRSSYLAFGP